MSQAAPAPRRAPSARLRAWVACAVWGALVAAPALAAPSDTVDLSSGGTPTLTGALGNAAVIANPDLLGDLAVTVDFGELSPLNRSGLVVARVPVIVRSTVPYALRVSLGNPVGPADPNALRPSDVGFGIQNLRPMAGARLCSNHQVVPPFDNDPSATPLGTTRVAFASSLADVGTSTLVLRGPVLSKGAVKPRKADNGWMFDVVLAVAPQFFTPGSSSITLTFTVVDAPSPACL